MDKILEHYDQLTRKMDIMEGLTIEKKIVCLLNDQMLSFYAQSYSLGRNHVGFKALEKDFKNSNDGILKF